MMIANRTKLFSAVLLLAGLACARGALAGSGTYHVRAGALHVGDGTVISDGELLIVDGRIEAVGKGLEVPEGAELVTVAAVTPGLIDANATLESRDIMTDRDRSAQAILHEFFCPTHKDHPVIGCCGSACALASRHVSGKLCPECGFPNAAPNMAVGTRVFNQMAEHSSEVVPHTRVIDSVNMRSPDLGRLLREGVTTVFVSPDSASVISSRGAIIHTGGPIRQRIVREADAVKASMGNDPSSKGQANRLPFRKNVTFHSRRPTTRMGVTWVFRKALHDTLREERGLDVYGADAPSREAMSVLREVLEGDVPLRIMARTQRDILAAIRLTNEFGIPFTLEEAIEAHLCLSEIKEKGCPVIYGPIFDRPVGYRAYTGEANKSRFNTMKSLLDAGIETALTAHELRDEDGLARQAMYAVRFGVAPGDAIRSVTLTPARIMGVDDKLGSLEVGKQADIVAWSGEPLEATSAPQVVMIGGEIVWDER